MNAHGKGVLLALAAALMWTVPATIIRVLLSELSPVQIVSLRLLIGTAVFLPLLLFWRKGLPSMGRREMKAAVILGLLFFSVLYLFAAAVQLTTVANSQFLNQTSTVFVFLIAHFLLKEPVTKRLYAALLVSLAGLAVIFGSGLSFENTGSAFGSLLALGSGMAFALYTAGSRHFRGMPSDAMLFVFMSATAISFVSFLQPIPQLSPGSWLLLAVLGAFTTIPYFVFTLSLKYAKAQQTALIANMTVITVPLFAFITLGETATVLSIVGGALILLASLLVIRDGQ